MLDKDEFFDMQKDVLDMLNDNIRDDPKLAKAFAKKLAGIYDLEIGKEIFGDLRIVRELLDKDYYDVLINLFIERQGIIDLKDENNKTLFLLAATYDKSSSFVKTVLMHRPKAVGQYDNYGNTAIILAAMHGKTNTVKAILEVCPDAAGQQDNNGVSAKTYAVNQKNKDMLEAIKAATNDFSPERQAVRNILHQ